MNYNELNDAIARLSYTSAMLEQMYEANEGEVTEATEALEAESKAIATLIEGDGIDLLGRWLTNKEAEASTLKAEKQAIDAKLKRANQTIDYIKAEVARVLDLLGLNEAKKGLIYSFKAVDKVSTHLTEESAEKWLKTAKSGALANGLPEYIDVSIRLRVSELPKSGELPEGIERETTRTARFGKPRKAKDDDANV